jgi:hypothetical protein
MAANTWRVRGCGDDGAKDLRERFSSAVRDYKDCVGAFKAREDKVYFAEPSVRGCKVATLLSEKGDADKKWFEVGRVPRRLQKVQDAVSITRPSFTCELFTAGTEGFLNLQANKLGLPVNDFACNLICFERFCMLSK